MENVIYFFSYLVLIKTITWHLPKKDGLIYQNIYIYIAYPYLKLQKDDISIICYDIFKYQHCAIVNDPIILFFITLQASKPLQIWSHLIYWWPRTSINLII